MVKLKTVCIDGKKHGVGYSKRKGLQCHRSLVWIFSPLLTEEVSVAGHAAESAVLGGECMGARD